MKIISTVSLVLLFCAFQQMNAQKKEGIDKIKLDYDLKKLNELQAEYIKKSQVEKLIAYNIAKEKGWKLKIVFLDGSIAELQRVTTEGNPIYYTTLNVDASKSTRTNHLNSGGSLGLNLNGNDMTAHVWDGGIARATHQEYDGSGGNNRYSVGDGTTFLNFHSAHVTGTIMASGVVANAKGMAPESNVVGYDWNFDEPEVISAASNGMLISNHSYGFRERDPSGNPLLPNYYFGGYITESRTWDEIMFNAPYYLMVVSAGNSGDDDTVNGAPLNGLSGYDKLTGHSTSKNNLVVANADDANVSSAGDLINAAINSTSSEGPTDDLRVKPDITGNGTDVYSTFEFNDNAYNESIEMSGTSMASPNIAGSLLLLQEHWYNLNNYYLKSATIKGLALHTANDLGTAGPDAIYGWGLMNTKKAAEVITSKGNESKIEELTLNSGNSYTFTVDSDGVNPLMASISWTDRPGTATTTLNSPTPVLVNDLDIRVSKAGNTFYPFRLQSVTTTSTGDNIVDPFERINVNNASGTYTVTISHKGSLVGGSQNYSLIVTGMSSLRIIGVSLVCNSPNETFTLTNATDPVTWQVSSNLQIVSSNNNSITVTANGNGEGFIEAILSDGTVRKDLWVGNPNEVTKLSHVSFGCTMGEIFVKTALGAEQYEWQVFGAKIVAPGTGTTYIGEEGSIFVDPDDGNYEFTVKVRGINACGYSNWYTKTIPMDCSGGPTPLSISPEVDNDASETIVAYPNPANDQITVIVRGDYEYTGTRPTGIHAIRVLDQNSIERQYYTFKQNRTVQTIDISYLTSGLNFLLIYTDIGVITKKILVR